MELGSGCVREEEEKEEDQQMMMMMMSGSGNSGGGGGGSSSSSSKGKLPFHYGTTSTSSFPTTSFYTQNGHYYHPQLLPIPASNPTNQEEEFQDQGGGEGGRGGQRDSNTNTNNNEVVLIQKEHMFDKVVTPSDVGKLNRLVIPKQHAERYFPLDSTNEKGLLLNFEDRNGKPWRFRYSYWNSSQSYVMTKGWSRFVKEKKLNAGDIISFQRGVGELGRDRLYIDWRKRSNAPDPSRTIYHHKHYHHFSNSYPWSASTITKNNFTWPAPPPPPPPPPILPRDYHLYWGNPSRNANHYNSVVASGGGGLYCYGGSTSISPGGTVFYMRPAAATAVGQQAVKYHYQQQGSGSDRGGGAVVEPVVQRKAAAAAKRLRLFGVNMECPITCTDTDSNSGEENKLSPLTSTTTASKLLTLHGAPLPPPPPALPQQYPHQMRFHNGSSIASATSVSNMVCSRQKGKPSSSLMSLDLDLSDDSDPH